MGTRPTKAKKKHVGNGPERKRALRSKAEDVLRKKLEDKKARTPEEVQSLIHELEVHQIELEMQNEELRQTQVALLESRDRYADLYDYAPFGYITINDKDLICEANIAVADLLGIERGKMVNSPFSRFIYEDDQDVYFKYRQDLPDTKEKLSCEVRVIKNGGQHFWAKLDTVPTNINNENSIHFRLAINDINELKQAEEKFKITDNRFNHVLRLMKSGVGVYEAIDDGEDFIVVHSYRAKHPKLDVIIEKMTGKRLLDVFPGVKRHGLLDVFKRVWQTGKPEHFPVTIYDGENIAGWRDNYVYRLPTGEIVAIYEDITERKKLEIELLDSEHLFRSIFETCPDPISINRLKGGKFTAVNTGFLKLLGYDESEVIGKTVLDIKVWQDTSKRKQLLKLLLADGSVNNFEANFRRKDGSVMIAQISAEIISYREEPHLLAVTQDISELKKAERQLLEAHEKLQTKFKVKTAELKYTQINYRMIADYTYDWEWWTNPDGSFRYVSPACERITGYKADRFIENDSFLREIIVLEDRDKWDKHDNESNKDIGLREMQFRIKRPDGEVRWIEHASQPVFTRENEFLGFRASNRDITGRKRAELAVRKMASFAELNPAPVMQVNSDGLIMECNPASLEILGKHAKTGASLSSMLPDLAKIDLDKCILEEQLLTQESYIEDRCYNFVLRGISGLSLVYIYGSDITKRKMAEEALRENRKRLIKAEQVAHMGFMDWNLKTNEIILSRELCDLYGLDLRLPITVEQIVEMVHPDDIEFVNENLNLAIKGSREYNIDHRMVRLDGKVIWVHARADLELDKDGRPVSLIGTVIDITERKLAEQKLQESETSLVKAQEVAHIGSWDLDLLENKLIWTDENYRIFGVPKGTPLTYEKFLEIVHPEDRDYVDEKWHAAIKGELYDIEHRLLIDNELKWVREKAELKFDDKGNPIGGVGITQDITERKLVEKEKQKLDKELNILSSKLLSTEELERKRIAGEIHDSIGQALSAIKFSVENSLIIIENGSIDSAIAALKKIVPLTQQTIEEVRNIVMALRPSTLDDLGLKATITWFCREFETVYTDIRVETEIYIEETDIPEQMKTVIFRIAQEAFNNAAKHSQSKHVYLSLEKIGDCLELVVEDKGCGFIVDEILAGTADKRGMGLASMRERALLSWGDIWIRSTPGVGTRIKVTWPMAAIFYKDE